MIKLLRPQNAKELFNPLHASLRYVVERILGTLKARFRILLQPMYYDLETEALPVGALCCWHNFIAREGGTVDGLQEEEEEVEGK